MDVPADRNCFLHAARFALLQLKDWNLTLVPKVATTRADVIRDLYKCTTACNHGRTHSGGSAWWTVRPGDIGKAEDIRLVQYDSWTKSITYMKKPDIYADTLFVFGLSALCDVSVRIVSDSYDEPHVFFLGFTESADMITISFLPSAEHYYASRLIAPITEEHIVAVTEVAAEDYTSPVYINPIDNSVTWEMHIHVIFFGFFVNFSIF